MREALRHLDTPSFPSFYGRKKKAVRFSHLLILAMSALYEIKAGHMPGRSADPLGLSPKAKGKGVKQ